MINLRVVSCVFLGATLVVGCASAAAPSPTIVPVAVPTADPTVVPTRAPSPTSRPTETASATFETLDSEGEQPLEAGTYRLANPGLPAFLITVPDSWRWEFSIRRPRPEHEVPPVAVQFWDVDHVYGHPCQWMSTLTNPGPTVDDLADALAEIPLRNATQPVDVTLDGYAGEYLEWSVPADMEVDEDGNFVDCDNDGLQHSFKSWTGRAGGSERYQQAPGQLDRLWILDVEGTRLVIDAFEMPYATAEEREELTAVVESIDFVD